MKTAIIYWLNTWW